MQEYYEVTFTFQGVRKTETIQARDSYDARKIIEARYPGAMISSAFKK